MNKDVTLLLLLEARDLASGAVRLLRKEIEGLTGAQKLHAAAFAGVGLAAAAGAYEVGKFAKDGIKHAINYQAEMTKLRTQARASAAEYKTMYDYLLQQGPKLGIGPEILAQGLLRVESVGFRARKSLLGLHETAKGMIDAVGKLQMVATGGKPDQIDIMGTAQVLNSMFTNRFKVDSSRGSTGFRNAGAAAGALTRVAGLGDMTLPELLRALQIGLIPAASAAHIDARSTFAALETMTDVQIPASRAAVYLRQVISMIQGARNKPKTENLLESLGMSGAELQKLASGPGGLMTTFDYIRQHLAGASMHGLMTAKSLFDTGVVKEKGGKPVSQWVKGDYEAAIQWLQGKLPDLSKHGRQGIAAILGVSARTTSIRTALQNVLDQVKSGPGDMGYADSVFNVLFGGARTGSGASALLMNPGRFRGRYEQNANLDKSSIDPAFHTVMHTAQGQIAQFHATVDALKTALGTGFLPVVTALLGGINKILGPLAQWTAHHKTLAAIIAGSMFVFFAVVAVIGFLSAAFIVLAGAAAAADIALGATLILAGIWAIAITAAILAIIAVGYLLIKHWSTVKKWLADFWAFVKGLFWAGVDAIKAALWYGIYAMLLPFEYLAKAAGSALGWIPEIGPKIKSATDAAVNFIEGFRHRAAAAMHKAGVEVRRGWDSGFGKQGAIQLVSEHGLGYYGRVGPAPGLMSEHGGGQGAAMPSAGTAPDYIGNVHPMMNSMVPGVGKVWDAVKTKTRQAWDDIGHWLEVKWNRMTLDAQIAWGDFRGWLGTLWGDIRANAVDAWNDVATWFGDLWRDIKNAAIDAWNDLVKWFQGLPGRILEAMGDAGHWLWKIGGEAVQGLWDGMVYVWNNAPGWISSAGSTVAGWFVGAGRWLWDLGGDAVDGLWGGMRAAFHTTVSWAGEAGQWVSDAIGSGARWLYDKGSNAAGGLWDGIKSGFQTAQTWVGQAAGWVSSAIGSGARWLWNVAGDAVSGFWGYITGSKGLQADASALFKTAGSWISSAVGDAGKWLWNLAGSAVTGFWNGLIHFFQHPGKFLKKIGDALIGMLKQIPGFNYLEKAFGAVSGAVGSVVGAVTGGGSRKTQGLPVGVNDVGSAGSSSQVIQSLSDAGASLEEVVAALRAGGDTAAATHLAAFGRIPQLAGGGIATRATLAMIGEAGPEAVVPLSRGGFGGGTTVIIDFTGAQVMDDASLNRIMDRIGDQFATKILPGAMQVRRR